MSLAKKFNKGTSIMGDSPFDVDTTNCKFIRLAKLFEDNGNDMDKVYPLKAVFVNTKSRFVAEEPVFVTDNYLVSLPQHMLEAVKEILRNEEDIQQIKDDKSGFKIRTYTSKKSADANAIFLSVEFVDVADGE